MEIIKAAFGKAQRQGLDREAAIETMIADPVVYEATGKQAIEDVLTGKWEMTSESERVVARDDAELLAFLQKKGANYDDQS
jgi:hypothetical protein